MVSYALGTLGYAALWICVGCALVGAASLLHAHFRGDDRAATLGYGLTYATAGALLVSCLVLVHGFFFHNVAIAYVAQNYPTDNGDGLFWLFQLAGLWSGRGGSLLLWGFLIAAFASWVAWHRRARHDRLSSIALTVMLVVIVLFVITMLFSSSNNPFATTPSSYIGSDGQLVGTAATWGMNALLEHWAMAIHPPTLFVGYAGMTVPFAYAVAALVCNDPSRRWVELCDRIALFAFIFLTIGIGLGAIWAYVVLGWGGYWGWDPVENASLLSWLTGVAMLHSFGVYRKRDQLKGWSLLSATLTFCFVVLGTFITRSGVVDSVHAFSEDPVSVFVFLLVIVAALAALGIGWFVRRPSRAFFSDDDIESVVSKNGSYYLTNLVMTFSGILLAYLTVSSALPGWMPLGGVTVGVSAYESVSRPLGIAFCALAAVCPFLAWRKTDGAQFARNVRVPAVVGAIVFVLLMVLFATKLWPAYQADVAAGGAIAAELADYGPAWYYAALAVLGLLVASLLAANSAYLLVRGVRARMANRGEGVGRALVNLVAKSPAAAGGYLTHLGLGIVLVGLVGSAMFVTERTYTIAQGEQATLAGYTITNDGAEMGYDANNNRILTGHLSIARGGAEAQAFTPSIKWTASTNYGQGTATAVTTHSLGEDFFVVLQGYNPEDGGDGVASLIINARVNPLISLAWAGFVVMVVGIVCATLPRRATTLADSPESLPAASATGRPATARAGSAKVARTSGAAAQPKKSTAPRPASKRPRKKR